MQPPVPLNPPAPMPVPVPVPAAAARPKGPVVPPDGVGLVTAGTFRRGLASLIDLAPLLTLWAAGTLGLGASVQGPLSDSRWNLLDRVVDALNQTPIVLGLPVAGFVLALFLWHFLGLALAGTTPGKRVLGLRVVSRDGGRPGVGRALAHSTLRVVSLALLAMGHLWQLADPARRTLYDRLAGVWVVSRVASPAAPADAAATVERPTVRG